MLDTAQRQEYQAAGSAQSFLPYEHYDGSGGQVPAVEAVRCRSLVEADPKMLAMEEAAILVGNLAALGDSCLVDNDAAVEVAVLECRLGMAIGNMALVVAVHRMELKPAVSVAAAVVDLYDGRVVGVQTIDALQGMGQDSSTVETALRLETDVDWAGSGHNRQVAFHSR